MATEKEVDEYQTRWGKEGVHVTREQAARYADHEKARQYSPFGLQARKTKETYEDVYGNERWSSDNSEVRSGGPVHGGR